MKLSNFQFIQKQWIFSPCSPPLVHVSLLEMFFTNNIHFPSLFLSLELNSRMGLAYLIPSTKILLPKTIKTTISCTTSSQNNPSKTHLSSSLKIEPIRNKIAYQTDPERIPTMSEIIEASKAQNLDLQLQKLGPFFRITAKSFKTDKVLGKAEGLIRVWFGGKRILHLDSIRLERETMGMERSIFGTGLFIGAVAVRFGYECGCNTAELLAINDSDLYHSKLVKFYGRIGFKPVYEVSGLSMGDFAHQLVWGGIGTRMDADINHLLIKWCTRFKSPN